MKFYISYFAGMSNQFDPIQNKSELFLFLDHIPEQKRVTHFSTRKSQFTNNYLLKFSSLTKLYRVLAYCLRYFHNSKPRFVKVRGRLNVKQLNYSQNKCDFTKYIFNNNNLF